MICHTRPFGPALAPVALGLLPAADFASNTESLMIGRSKREGGRQQIVVMAAGGRGIAACFSPSTRYARF